MATTDPTIYRYTDLVKQQHKRLTGMDAEQRAAQLGYSSLDDAFLPVFDARAQLRMWVGRQPDDTFAVSYANGDPPPAPLGMIVAPREGAFLVGWDGTFVDGAAMPGDFARVDIHVSEEGPDFIPTGATVVGYLLGEAATLVPIDHVTHWVKLVAVTVADVASTPTQAQSVLPEPIGTIAADAIGANQLASEIVLVENRFIAGDPNASHLEFNGYEGLELFDDTLQRTIHFDPDTGNAVITGQIRTTPVDSGQRMVWNPESVTGGVGVLFYDGTREDMWSQLASASLPYVRDNNIPGPTINMLSPFVADLRAFTQVSDIYQAGLIHLTGGTQQAYSVLKIDDLAADLYAGHFPPQAAYTAGSWYGQMRVLNPQRTSQGVSLFGHNTADPDAFIGLNVQYSPSMHATFLQSNTQVQCLTADAAGFVYLDCLDVRRASSAAVKKNITGLPTSPLQALRNAPVTRFHYTEQDNTDQQQVGVMAEDLPEWLHHDVPTPAGPQISNDLPPGERVPGNVTTTTSGTVPDRSSTTTSGTVPDRSSTPGISLASQIGWLIAAVRELDTELDTVRELLPPGRRKTIARVIREDAT